MTREEKKSWIFSSFINDAMLESARECIMENHCIDEPNYEPTDDEVYSTAVDYNNMDWYDVEYYLKNRFATGKFLLIGEAGRWNGTFAGGKVLDGFDEVEEAWAHRDYMDIEMYDLCKGGHYEFHVLGHHHDGTDHWAIKELTDKGIQYYENWNYNYGDKRTEEEIHKVLWGNSHYSHNVEFTKKYYR